ncbi:MAG: lipid-A-disaccharide synthase N-terminal domain-containing protein [Chthoniobacteraceae bacterium]
MFDSFILAVTAFGKETRFLGLDWSWLMLIGLAGNMIFSMRFLVQWIESEKRGESVIPISFWYWSIAGSAVMALYFIFRRDPIGILGYLPNTFIYVRNLRLIRKKKLALTAAAPSQTPIES